MADITGSLHREFRGRTYTLRLTPLGLARLQADHGNDLGGVLSGAAGDFPPFAVLVGIVSEALKKGEGMAEAEAQELADDMLAADVGLAGAVLEAAFPDQRGNAAAPRKAKG